MYTDLFTLVYAHSNGCRLPVIKDSHSEVYYMSSACYKLVVKVVSITVLVGYG